MIARSSVVAFAAAAVTLAACATDPPRPVKSLFEIRARKQRRLLHEFLIFQPDSP